MAAERWDDIETGAGSLVDLRQASDHLHMLWDGLDHGILNLAEFPESGGEFLYWFGSDNLDGAARHVVDAATMGRTVYASMGMRNARPASGRGDSATVSAIPGGWGEVDYLGPGHKRTDLPPDQDAALDVIADALPLRPTMIIHSGGGFYPLWLFKEPWHFENPDEQRRAEFLLDRIGLALKYAGKPHGYHVDNVSDLARLLRVAGTGNLKIPDQPRPVSIFSTSGPRYTLDELEEILPELSNSQQKSRSGVPVVAESEERLTDEERAGLIAGMSPAWGDGARHNSAVYFAGYCWNAGINEADALQMVEVLSRNDRKPVDRLNAVENTYTAGRSGKRVSGYFGLRDTVGVSADDLTRMELTRGAFRNRIEPKIVRLQPHMKTQPPPDGQGEPPGQEPPGPSSNDELNATPNSRPIIDAGDEDLERTSSKAWAALMAANNPPRLFRTLNGPVRLESVDQSITPTTQPLNDDRMSFELARAATWIKTRGKVTSPAYPPIRVVSDLLVSPEIPLPLLDRIVGVPVYGPLGELQTTPGYHAGSRTFYAPAPGFELEPVAQRPTDAELSKAISVVEDVIADFPFVADADRSHAVGEMLQPYARSMILGPTPIHMHEAPTAGSGKDLLAEALMWSSLGQLPNSMTYSPNGEEMRKKITATLRMQPEAVLIPNVNKIIDSGDLCDAVSRPIWQDRVLGVSETIRVPVRCVWIISANNPGVSKEVARRTIRIRLDSGLERPEERPAESFRHPKLVEWVRDNRASIAWACLTIIQHWIAIGKPAGKATLGTYEAWASVIGGILDAIRMPGFLANRAAFYEAADTETSAWGALVDAWWDAHRDARVGTSVLFAIANQLDGFDFGKGSDRSQQVTFGMQLVKQRDRIYGDRQIRAAGEYRRAKQWQLHELIPGNVGSDHANPCGPSVTRTQENTYPFGFRGAETSFKGSRGSQRSQVRHCWRCKGHVGESS